MLGEIRFKRVIYNEGKWLIEIKYYAAVSVAQAYVTSHQITGIINAFNQITINVSGFNITFRGNVINGNLHIGTFFII